MGRLSTSRRIGLDALRASVETPASEWSLQQLLTRLVNGETLELPLLPDQQQQLILSYALFAAEELERRVRFFERLSKVEQGELLENVVRNVVQPDAAQLERCASVYRKNRTLQSIWGGEGPPAELIAAKAFQAALWENVSPPPTWSDESKIRLFWRDEAGLILRSERGALYTNQTHGALCSHPLTRGLYLPLPDGMRDALVSVGEGIINDGTMQWQLIRPALERYLPGFEPDSELEEISAEAWLFLRCSDSERARVALGITVDVDLTDARAILTYPNSD